MFACGLEVLADGDDIDADAVEVAEGVFDFVVFLADTEHDAGLGGKAFGFGVGEDFGGDLP